MGFRTEVFPSDQYARRAAARIAGAIDGASVAVLTGGSTAERVLPALARERVRWDALAIAFSDERCVPPDHPASNYGKARRLLLEPVGATRVHRIRGEDAPERAAAAYEQEIAPLVEGGLDVVVLGMGADNHICALFPGSPALHEQTRLCLPVDRPDGLQGVTLTPAALAAARRVFVIVAGERKAPAVRRALDGEGDIDSNPVLVLADLPAVTFLLDDKAAGSS